MALIEHDSTVAGPDSNGEHTALTDQGLINGDLQEEVTDAYNNEAAEDDPVERFVAYQAIDSFHKYRSMAHSTIHRRRQNLYALPSPQWRLLAGPPFYLLDSLSNVDDAIDANARLAEAIVDATMSSMNFPHDPSSTDQMPWNGFAKINDHNKAQSTLRQFYRDWTSEGYEAEVKPLLDIILTDLQKHSNSPLHPPSSAPDTHQSNLRPASNILLPGAGISRLLLELVLHGHNATGNEISYHQLMASNFILNHNSTGANSFTIYPWATNFCNTISRSHQLRSYTVPDIDAATAVAEAHKQVNGVMPGQMGMAAGDFCTSFNGEDSAGEFTTVVTAYFVDTAPNLFRYIQTVHNCLKEGGLWINIGPLLWHFDARDHSTADDNDDDANNEINGQENEHSHTHASGHAPNNAHKQKLPSKPEHDAGIAAPGSFELTHEEILQLLEQSGFEILIQEILPDGFTATCSAAGPGIYLQDPQSMMQMRYRCGHWVARKVGGGSR